MVRYFIVNSSSGGLDGAVHMRIVWNSTRFFPKSRQARIWAIFWWIQRLI